MGKYYFSFLVIISFLISCSESSSPTDAKYDSSINGKSIVIRPNQKYIVELDVHADGGFEWTYKMSNQAVVNIDSIHYRPKSGNWNQEGGLTIETFYFSGRKAGQCAVHLIEHRVWEKDVPPINTVTFNVIVK